MGKVPPRVPGRNAFPAATGGGGRPTAIIYAGSVAGAVPDSTDTILPLDAGYRSADADDWFSFDSSTYMLTLLQDAVLLVVAYARLLVTNCDMRVRVYPASAESTAVRLPADSTGRGGLQHVVMAPFLAGDQFQVRVYQNSGGASDLVYGDLELTVLNSTAFTNY